MSKGKGQQIMEHGSFSLEFQLPDGKYITKEQLSETFYGFMKQ